MSVVKIPKDVAERILLCLVGGRYIGFSAERLVDDAYSWWDAVRRAPTPPHNRKIYDAVNGYFSEHKRGILELEELQSALASGLTTPKRDMLQDKALLDKIIEILKNAGARNVISGNTLKALRYALLLPEETAGLVERLRRKEMSCSGCGHPFMDGEVVTFRAQDPPGFVCASCYLPTVISCTYPGCEAHVALPPAFRKNAEKAVCPAHKGGDEKPKATNRPTENAIVDRLRGAATRIRADRPEHPPIPDHFRGLAGVPTRGGITGGGITLQTLQTAADQITQPLATTRWNPAVGRWDLPQHFGVITDEVAPVEVPEQEGGQTDEP